MIDKEKAKINSASWPAIGSAGAAGSVAGENRGDRIDEGGDGRIGRVAADELEPRDECDLAVTGRTGDPAVDGRGLEKDLGAIGFRELELVAGARREGLGTFGREAAQAQIAYRNRHVERDATPLDLAEDGDSRVAPP